MHMHSVEIPMTHSIQLEDSSKFDHLQIEAWTLTDLQYLEIDSYRYSITVVFALQRGPHATLLRACVPMRVSRCECVNDSV